MGRPKGSRNKDPHPRRMVIRRTIKQFPPPTPQPTPCRLWQGVLAGRYGAKHVVGRPRNRVLIHRWVWEQVHGEIPDGVKILHKCDNPTCYRYDHLFSGTQKDNIDDMVNKGRGWWMND